MIVTRYHDIPLKLLDLMLSKTGIYIHDIFF